MDLDQYCYNKTCHQNDPDMDPHCLGRMTMRPLAAAIIGLENTGIPIPEGGGTEQYWTDHDALEAYLKTPPTCYLIIGKQGTENFSLGETFSKKRSCIHLCPENILSDEIKQKSMTGKCIDFNLRHNKVCKSNLLIAMLKHKLESPVVKHRGFVISGFPLVDTSTSISYIFDRFHTEESLTAVEEIVQELLEFKTETDEPENVDAVMDTSISTEKENTEEKEERKSDDQFQLRKCILEPCNNIVTGTSKIYYAKKSVIYSQINEIFKAEPNIIINITCPHSDLVTKRDGKYYNYITNKKEISQFPVIVSHDFEVTWPLNYKIPNYNKTIDHRVFNLKYNCKHPLNFKEKTYKQTCNFIEHTDRCMEEKLKEFHPSKTLNLDGRITLSEKMHIIQERLSLMDVTPVLIPESLFLDDASKNNDQFWADVENFNVLRADSLNFNRRSSPWHNLCPVELSHRHLTYGNAKYSVALYKYVYLLSSPYAMSLFRDNPRSFLKLDDLKPNCKVIIIGTKATGKSMIAHCLSWIFDTPIISYKKFYREKILSKYKSVCENIFSEVIATIEDKRKAEWDKLEVERKKNLNEWLETVTVALETYLTIEKNKSNKKHVNTILYRSKFESFEEIKDILSCIPILDDTKSCKKILQNKTLTKFAPKELITETNKLANPVIDDDDAVREIDNYISNNNLENDLLPSNKEIMQDLINRIQCKCDDFKTYPECGKEKYNDFILDGFPSDLKLWEYLIESEKLPDYIIALYDKRELNDELINLYDEIEMSMKNYKERICLANDPLIKTKLQQKISYEKPITSTSYIEFLLNKILKKALSYKQVSINTLTRDKEAFEENWNTLKSKLREKNKCYIEVNIENKIDIKIIDETLLKLRKCYSVPCRKSEMVIDNVDQDKKDIVAYNEPVLLGETNVYCPVCFFDHGILWKGNQKLSLKYDSRVYYFSRKECKDTFERDPTMYQRYNSPYKKIPCIRICIMGCVGSGKSTIAKKIADEMGLIYIDFDEYIINTYLIPKRFKKVGWKYENSFSGTSYYGGEVLSDEEISNLGSEVFNNENHVRRIIHNYFEKRVSLPFSWVKKMLTEIWNDTPYVDKGFVLDGFPKTAKDVKYIMECFCVPDLAIDLKGHLGSTLKRLSPNYSELWIRQLKEAKQNVDLKLQDQRITWLEDLSKKIIAKLTIDYILDKVSPDPDNTNRSPTTKVVFNIAGAISSDPEVVRKYDELVEEYPAPTDHTEWETWDSAIDKMKSRWEEMFKSDLNNLEAAKNGLLEHNIKVIPVNALKKEDKVLAQLSLQLKTITSRCQSFLEQTFAVSSDVAEMLLLEGFVFLSRFNRLCPVFITENPKTILHTYNICKDQGKLYPVIHRSYIYFISSKDNLVKFRKDPLKYLDVNILKSYRPYSISIGIIGPPKSGKSKLAAKLAKHYGLFCVSKGMVIRYIVEQMGWTELGKRIERNVSSGATIEDEHFIKAVLTVVTIFSVNSNGVIFDGFPETVHECSEFLKNGLYPIIMFQLDSNLQSIEKNCHMEVYNDIIKYKPPFSKPMIRERFNFWVPKFKLLKDWIEQDTQNLYVINNIESQWKCLSDAREIIESIIPKIHYYLDYVDWKVVSANMFGISNETFEIKMSRFKNFCPVCLKKNILRHSYYPPDKSGLVQYKDKLYWFCPKHLGLVLKYTSVLTLLTDVEIPDIPVVIKHVDMTRTHEDGICLVTYKDNLPSYEIVNGKEEYPAMYKGRVYLFCSPQCHEKFLATPHLYFDITIPVQIKILQKTPLKSLPHLDYLEETVSAAITDACCAVNQARPKYLGLDIRLSALIYIGLHLKICNPLADSPLLSTYKNALRSYENRCQFYSSLRKRIRCMTNPFAFYPICCVCECDSECVCFY